MNMNSDKIFIPSVRTWIDYYSNKTDRVNPYIKHSKKQIGGGLSKSSNDFMIPVSSKNDLQLCR